MRAHNDLKRYKHLEQSLIYQDHHNFRQGFVLETQLVWLTRWLYLLVWCRWENRYQEPGLVGSSPWLHNLLSLLHKQCHFWSTWLCLSSFNFTPWRHTIYHCTHINTWHTVTPKACLIQFKVSVWKWVSDLFVSLPHSHNKAPIPAFSCWPMTHF